MKMNEKLGQKVLYWLCWIILIALVAYVLLKLMGGL